MLATVTNLLRHHVPAAEALVAGDDAIRHHWEALLATATSPAERDEINDVFGRAIRQSASLRGLAVSELSRIWRQRSKTVDVPAGRLRALARYGLAGKAQTLRCLSLDPPIGQAGSVRSREKNDLLSRGKRPIRAIAPGGEAQIAETTYGQRRLIVRRTRLIGPQPNCSPTGGTSP